MAPRLDREIPHLLKLDWVSRHERFRKLPRRTANSVAARLAPDQLLWGACTSSKAPHGAVYAPQENVVNLNDIVIKKRKVAKKGPRQTKICQFWTSRRCDKHRMGRIAL